ncbi:helix-turn-helix domain-containing protein [Streptomyces sp. NPDC006798]|uniref:helix-turn-helix domain-containing protein n=1 Tax=Streptomyces sp. NPDC006798 TaxID=3155462 RepID=UPI0034035365
MATTNEGGTGAPTGSPTLIGSVRRALRLLEAAAGHPAGAPAKVLARAAAIPLPTAYHLLRTLVHEGYLRRERGVFVLGDALGRLGGGGPGATCGAAAGGSRIARLTTFLDHWRNAIGVPVYCAVYREGEIRIVAVSDSPYAPAVGEWAAFRETGHAHAIGQCLLGRLGPAALHDHLDRHPVTALTPYSVRDRAGLLARLAARGSGEPVVERQEYALGTVCAAVPVPLAPGGLSGLSGSGGSGGSGGLGPVTAATMAISLPLDQEERLLPAIELLRTGAGGLLGALAISISI